MEIAERDQRIAEEYKAGKPASKLATDFGISVPQIRRVLKAQGVVGVPRPQKTIEEKVVDKFHLRIGNRLYGYRFKKTKDADNVSELLGWSVRKLRSVEQGRTSLSLQDLLTIANFMETTVSELTKEVI